jgi:hypothetical protein
LLGVVSELTLLTKSLLHECKTPTDIGCFVVLDVDVGGIPRDSLGLIRSGVVNPAYSLSGSSGLQTTKVIREGK